MPAFSKELIQFVKNSSGDYCSPEHVKDEDIRDIANRYQVPISFVETKFEDLILYCGSKGKSYSNYKQALASWVKKDCREAAVVERTNAQPVWEEVPEITVDERERQLAHIREIIAQV